MPLACPVAAAAAADAALQCRVCVGSESSHSEGKEVPVQWSV